jgi:hypothetical protein
MDVAIIARGVNMVKESSHDYHLSAAIAVTVVKYLTLAERERVFEAMDKLDDLLQELEKFRPDMTLYELIGGVAMLRGAADPINDDQFFENMRWSAGLKNHKFRGAV